MNPWILAIRPKTLPASIVPVFIGSAMAYGDGLFHWLAATCALLASVFIQIGTNLANDYFDFKKGADTQERQGPVRVVQAGLIKPRLVLLTAILFFILAALASVYLINRAGMAILIIAVASIISGLLYTAGPKPLAYLGLGELFVFIFFGPVAVGGTYYVQALDMNWAVVVAGFAPGFLSTAILVVNNLRDMDTDRRAGKRTLAVRFGRSFAINEYFFCVIAAGLVPFMVNLVTSGYKALAVSSLILVWAIPYMKTVCVHTDGPALNKLLAQTGQLLLIYSCLFAVGWVLCSR